MSFNNTLQKCAWLCYKSYSPEGNAERFDIGNGITFYLLHHGDVAYVCVRGTDEVRDWMRNLNTSRVAVEHGSAHEGFLAAADRIVDRLSGIEQGVTIHLTGHSMGGSVAALVAYRLYQLGKNVGRVFTMGAPRFANPELCEFMDARIDHTRIVNGNDAIPRVPTRIRFKHCGSLLYFNRKQEPVWNPSYLYMSLDRILGWRLGDTVREHSVYLYCRLVWAMLKGK